ncbi:MAG: hypothetical protein ACREQI_03215 [Candidatus Binataceae bacterium]
MATDETERLLYSAFRDAQTRYTYFILTAAGAGIALAVNQTNSAALSWSQVPLAAAVLSWGLSFFFGCRHLGYANSTIFSNLELIKVKSGKHPEAGLNQQMVAAASAGIREAIDANSKAAMRYGTAQFRLLVAGGLLYVGWYVLEMYLRRHT